ncbi:MAG: FAD-dependent oxidoreductase [Actinomycetota bacterium]|nr:FAD-dependent oxidoreductase [Actinomycetota bacterium]
MTATSDFLIIGGGLAGARAAEALRREGFDGGITLVGEEPLRPYLRPPLSKDYLQGKAEQESLFVHPAVWYRDHDVDLVLGTAATSLDRTHHNVVLADGSRRPFDRLLLCTGSTPKSLTIPGADLDGVHYLRRMEDSERIKEAFAGSPRVVVIGGGWIGLETAAAARAAGLQVTILETAALPLVGVLGPHVAQVFAELHRSNGVDLRCNVEVERLTGDAGRVTDVTLGDGSIIPADLVIVGVGITPNVALADEAGIDVDNGIVVDEHLQSSDPEVFAAGDVANAFNRRLDRHVRVEHWANAEHQPAIAAMSMMDRTATYDRLPFFYSDQYDLGLEYTGYAEAGDYDRVVFRGDVESREFIAFWLAGHRVLAGMNVNTWDVSKQIEAIITSGLAVDANRLADVSVSLEDVRA